MRGYPGGMIPRDMDWDYIIVHETGHEYFGNSVSCNDLAEMWIHESFTTYLEALYVEYRYDYASAIRYMEGQRSDASFVETVQLEISSAIREVAENALLEGAPAEFVAKITGLAIEEVKSIVERLGLGK